MYKECRHIKPDGAKCNAAALTGKPYCYFHNSLHLLKVRKRSPSKKKQLLNLPTLEDGASIQIALTQILSGIGSDSLEPRRAGLLLYGLQIAAQNVQKTLSMEAFAPVRSLSVTSNGDELGPEVNRCDPPEDCPKCRFRNSCSLSEAKDTESEGEAESTS